MKKVLIIVITILLFVSSGMTEVVSATEPSSLKVILTAKSTPVWSSASSKSTRVGTMPENTPVEPSSGWGVNNSSSNWLLFSNAIYSGRYCYSNNLKSVSHPINHFSKTITFRTTKSCQVRSLPYTKSRLVKTIPIRENIEITGSVTNILGNVWYKYGNYWIYSGNVVEALSVPLRGAYTLTSEFGLRKHPIYNDIRMHNGVDLGTSSKALPVYPARKGKIFAVGVDAQKGNYVIIEHSDVGLYTSYFHLEDGSTKNIQKGAYVDESTIIGAVGDTGDSTGIHLHFEISRYTSTGSKGAAVEPRIYIKFN